MLRFASPVPSVFSGLDALQPRHVERPSAEEQYFQRLAEEHERAAALARKRLTDVRRQRQQQQALEAQLALQQQLATAFHVPAPQRPSYNPTRGAPMSLADAILEFGVGNERELYAERMRQRTQEHQKRVEQQAAMRALFEQRRRAQAERVAEIQRRRALEAKAQQERQLKAQEEARRQQAARAADEEKIRQFFQALMGAVAQEGAELERKNAIRRNSAPAQEKPKDVPAPAPKSAPVSPKVPERAASPAPSVASDASDASLNSIALLQDKYDTLRSGFTFPTTLVFAPSTSSPNASPSLLYNPTNAPVHAYEHALTNLLTELDAVESFGDSHVRDVRRSLARRVEAELEALEVKKRDVWRSQSVRVEVEAPAAVESVPVESAPVEPTPATESAPAPESTPVDPAEFLATRLAVPAESEDEEVKAVRESLLASLTTEPIPVSTEADKDEVIPKDEPVAESESTSDNATEPEATPVTETETTTAVEAEPVTETIPTETETEPVVESVPEPEVADAHTPTATPEIVISVPESVTVAPEPEATPASPVESVASSSEPEVVHHEVEPTVVVQPEPESVTQPESDCPASTLPKSEPTIAPAHQVPESATQPEPEHLAFVKVYPDSESDSESDLASELAERKSTAGDEFELL